MEAKMKCWLFLLIILLFVESYAQTQMQNHVMMICTHHLNELAAHGFNNIFERDGEILCGN